MNPYFSALALNLKGGSGMAGGYSGADNPNPTGIIGGSSFWGGAGGSIGNINNTGTVSTIIDATHGGGGGTRGKSNASQGGNGGIGVVFVEEYA